MVVVVVVGSLVSVVVVAVVVVQDVVLVVELVHFVHRSLECVAGSVRMSSAVVRSHLQALLGPSEFDTIRWVEDFCRSLADYYYYCYSH